MKYGLALLMFSFLFALIGCATSYQPKSLTGGFSETRLAENVYQVSFRGNAYTDMEKAADFTLLRSAEIALNSGYRYFAVVDAQSWQKQGVVTTPVQSTTTVSANTFGSINHFGNFGTYNGSTTGTLNTVTTGGDSYVISKPRTSNTIVLLKEQPVDGSFSFDAQFVTQSLKSKYGIP